MKLIHVAILVIFLAVAAPDILHAQDSDDQQSPEQVAYIRLVEGEVGYQRGDDSQAQWSAAAMNTPLMPGDSLYANDRSRAEIQLGDGNFLRVGTQGYIGLLQSDDHTFQFKVASGTATLRLQRLDRNYEIDAPNFAFTAEDPGEYRVDVSANGDTQITLHRGRGAASIANRGEEDLRAPARLNVANDSAEFTISRKFKRDDWDRWNRRRDSLAFNAARPQYIPPGVYGYEGMSGYGRWVETRAYGPVWVPAMGRDWQPYRLGRWVWVDPFGWTWVSYEPWGWAPYHYGRWAYVGGMGWAWAPGPPTVRQRFAAALVGFLSGNEGGEWVGWFPLGPGEVYEPYARRDVYVVRPVRQYVNYNYVTVVNRTEIYNSTTVVYQTRVVNQQVIEHTQVVANCNIPPSRETLYTPAVHVNGTRVVPVSNTSHPAPQPAQQIIERNVHVRTAEVPNVRKFDDKLAEMQRAGVVRPVNPYQPAQPMGPGNRGAGNSADGSKVVRGNPNPPGHNEQHGRSGEMPPGLYNKNVPTAAAPATGPASVPAATTNAPPARVPAAAEEHARPRYQPPAEFGRRVGQPASTPAAQEQARPKSQPAQEGERRVGQAGAPGLNREQPKPAYSPQEVERRVGQAGAPGLDREQPKPAYSPGQINDRRPDEPRPATPAQEQVRPSYQPPSESDRRVSQPPAPEIPRREARPGSQPSRPVEAHASPGEDKPSAPAPAAVRAQQSTPAQSADTSRQHEASRATAPTQAGYGVQPSPHDNGHQTPKAAAKAEQPRESKQTKQADSPRPGHPESKKKSAEDEGKDKK